MTATWAALTAAAAVLYAIPPCPRPARPLPTGASPRRWQGLPWWVAARRRRADADAVLGVCDALATELLAGRPPGEALASAGVQWTPLRPVVEAFHLGLDVPEALRRLAVERPGAADLRLLAAAWQVSHTSGHGLARAVGRTAAGIRHRRRTRRVVESELASARATARLVCVLPFAVLLAGSGAAGDPWRFLLATPVGLACLVAGLALIAAGLAWIETIAGRAAPP